MEIPYCSLPPDIRIGFIGINFEKNQSIFAEGAAVKIKGRLSDKDGTLKILCEIGHTIA